MGRVDLLRPLYPVVWHEEAVEGGAYSYLYIGGGSMLGLV